MAKKKGLSFKEHRDAAILMKQAYENVLTLGVTFSKAYSRTTGPWTLMEKARKNLFDAKNLADDLFFKDHPAVKQSSSSYFGEIDKI